MDESQMYRRVWITCITQALRDACSIGQSDEMFCERIIARDWFEGDSEDFRTVCDLAGLHPEEIRRKALRTIAEHDRQQAKRPKPKPRQVMRYQRPPPRYQQLSLMF